MSVPRKFDWAEARRMRSEGMTYRAISSALDVSLEAIRVACDDEARARARSTSAEWQRGGECVDCGTRCTRVYPRCLTCAALKRATSVRENELRCVMCREWKPDDSFPFNRAESVSRRKRHGLCRLCQTEAKRSYRARNREAQRLYERERRRRTRVAA